MYPNIDRLLGLHQRLEVFYVVDGYSAQLLTDDERRAVAIVHGATIPEALAALDAALARFTVEDIRT